MSKRYSDKVVIEEAQKYWPQLARELGTKVPKDVARCASKAVTEDVWMAWQDHGDDWFGDFRSFAKEWFDPFEVIHLSNCCVKLGKKRKGSCKMFDEHTIKLQGDSFYESR